MWQPAAKQRRRQWYRYGLLALVVGTLAVAVTMAGTAPADANSELQVSDLNVTGVNETVANNVTAANVTTMLHYDIDVPTGDRRVIRLKAGPTANDTVTLDYDNAAMSSGQEQGTVALSGDLFRHEDLTQSLLQPGHGETRTTDIVVVAEVTVSRPNAPDVTTETVEPVTITLTDEGGPVARIGGTGNVTVQTAG